MRCNAREYLDNRDRANPDTWRCKPCPPGGACEDPDASWSNLGPLFGWWKIPKEEDSPLELFAPCLFPPACLGASNPALENMGYFDADDNNLALMPAL